MKLAFLNLERFGARSNLQLDDLSQQLNVVYGPNGSGKTTIINFIRWVLYGSDAPACRPYLSTSDARSSGSLRVIDGEHQVRVVSRLDDGSVAGKVSMSRVTGDILEYERARLTGVDLEEYGHIFSFGFDQPSAIEETIRVAASRGFNLTYDERQVQHLQDLEQQLADLQYSYQGMRESEENLSLLHARREEVRHEIELVERARSERLRELEGEVGQIQNSLVQRRNLLAEVEAGLRRAEEKIATRRNQLEGIAQESREIREESIEAGRREADQINEQIQQWRNVLQAIRERLENLQRRLADWEPAAQPVGSRDEAEFRLYLRTLGFQIDDLEHDLHDLALPAEVEDHQVTSDYLRSVLDGALQTMRHDVQNLVSEIQRQKQAACYHDHAQERQRLRRCESEMTDLIEDLERRREQLLSQDAYVPRESSATKPSADWTDFIGDSVIRPWYETTSHATNGTTSTNGNAAPKVPALRRYSTDLVLETRLNHLVKRRDYLAARVQDGQREMSSLEHRLETLMAGRDKIDEQRRFDTLQREREHVEQRIQEAEQRQHLRQRMDTLHREIEDLRKTLGPSDIVREASSNLQRMTGGSCRQLRVNEMHEVWVEDDAGKNHRHSELSRGTQDQVYLSISLALVAAYYARGVELPLILNDVFVNVDTDRASLTAEVLEDFSGRGHQVVLFTRHEHVSQLFSSSRIRRFKLQQRTRSVASDASDHHARYLDQLPATGPYPTATTRSNPNQEWMANWEANRRLRGTRPAQPPSRIERSLSDETPLSHVDGIDLELVSRLNEIDIHTVQAFIQMDPEQGEQALASFGITAQVIHRWQSIVTLQTYVGLTADDASLLVLCGVDDPQELAYIDVSELHRRIEQFLDDTEHRSRFGAISRYERSRLSRWIQAARQSRFRRHRSSPSRITPQRTPPLPANPRIEPKRMPRPRMAQPEVEPTNARDVPLRFFLEPSDPIVDAPSIGPKTAERFHAIEVKTVADLLDKDPEEVAEQIDYRRITPKLIHQWQMQTQLVCRIPNLRGHDAQILVACDVTTPRQLASIVAEELHNKVQRFIRTSEGKRILRNGKRPDLAEVTAWIQWAESARELQLS